MQSPLPAATTVEVAAVPRWRALALAPLRWLAILFVPDRALPGAVTEGRYGGPMLVAMAAALAAALTIAGRVDLSERVYGPAMAAEAQGGPGGAAAAPTMSDREIEEATVKARAVEQVTRGLGAGMVPVEIFGLGFALLLLTRYVGGRPTLGRAVALAASASLPGAIRSVLQAIAAAHRAVIPPSEVAALVLPPLQLGSPVLTRLVAGVDPFTLWSLVLVALGMPAMAGISRRRAWIVTIASFALWLVLSRLALAAPPNPGAHP